MALRTTARAAALALTAGLLASGAATGTAYAAAEPVAGGPTASPADSLFPNQGNSGYDVSHYDIDLSADFTPSTTANAVSSSSIDATATITATTTGAPLSSYSFDFQGSTGDLAGATLNVSSVSVDGVPATFTRIENTTAPTVSTDVHKLIVTPATPVSGSFTTVVEYAGRPVAHTDADGSSEGWNHTTDGATFLNQPVGSMTLFPNNNTPRDTATYTFTIDIPSKLSTSNFAQAGGKPYPSAAVSNGELVSRTPSADGSRTTWVWDQRKPMASELSLVSIGRYDMYTSDIVLASGRTIPEWTFIDPAISTANQSTTLGSRAQLKSILDFFETKYGPYPGNSTGLVTDVVPSAINYALETQDRSFFPNSASRGTTYHEVMHQWWGNQVTPTDWNDLWVSEGSATYSESQFPFEGAGSSTTSPETALFSSWNSSNATSSTWTIPTAAMTAAGSLFGGQVYNRGAWTLAALKTAIGDADFETVMSTYQSRYAGVQTSTRRTALFIALAEEVSGRDLTAFFQPWLYGTTKAPWPVKFTLDLAGPTTQVNPGDTATFTVSARNTGKVAMPAGGTTIAVDLADVLDDATIGTLPADTTLDGTVLTWTVPATALAATASIAVPVTVSAGAATDGATLKPVARAVTLGGTCLECESRVVVGASPISPAPAPAITGLTSGAPVVGQTVSADTAGWPAGTSFGYQWHLGGTPIAGATSATYTPTGEVIGLALTVKVTGTLSGSGTTSATSPGTGPGVRGTQPAAAVPSISGVPKVGERLTVDPGSWLPGTVFTYQWRANGTNISAATGPSYVPAVAAQVGQTIDVVVTGTKFGWTTTARTSGATGAVVAGDALSSTPTPTLGTPRVGAALIAVPGFWDDGVILTYSWQANGTNISGATAVAYTPTAAQLGQGLTITVTGTRPGIAAVSRTSAAGTVEAGSQVLQPSPSITGTPRAESPVTGATGTWDTGTTLTHQWYADGVAIADATGTTYTPTLAQIGQALTFEVTSTRTGYTTVTRTSAPSTVLGLTQTLTPTPTVSGTPKVGVELTAVPGTWDDDTTLAYQWLADDALIDGATTSTYTPGPARVGAAISVRVTSTRPDHETVSRTSAPGPAVARGSQALTPVPTIGGTARVDSLLTVDAGTWDGGTALSYQWSVGGVLADGATGTAYVVGSADVGRSVTVTVTGTRAGYDPVTRASAGSVVVAGSQALRPKPRIKGTARVGRILKARAGGHDTGVTVAYSWLVDGKKVGSRATLTVRRKLLGERIRLVTTASRPGYDTVVARSAATSKVKPKK